MIGAALAPEWLPLRLGAGLVAFFLGLGIAAHAFDELQGRPLGTRIPAGVLWALAVGSLAGAVAIGIAAAVAWTPWLLAFVAFGGFMVCAYNLELFGGRFHGDWWLAVAWGAHAGARRLPRGGRDLTWQALFAAAFGVLLILAQRRLSTPVRAVAAPASGGRATRPGPRSSAAPRTRCGRWPPPSSALAIALVILRARLTRMAADAQEDREREQRRSRRSAPGSTR